MLDRLKMAAVQELGIPKDVVLGEVLVSFAGRCCVTVENYRGILLYDDQTVKLQARNCRLEIRGRRLHIAWYNHDQMMITGQIQAMEFIDA